VVPRLWFTGERNPFAYRRVQHICPYCGAVMYVTGGGVNWAMTIYILVVIAACALFLLVALKLRRF
jgi:hypothetical protein